MQESDDLWLVNADLFGSFLIFRRSGGACDMFDSDYGRKTSQVNRIIIILESIGFGLYDILAIFTIFRVTGLSAQFPLCLAQLAENVLLLHLSVPLQLFCAIEQAFIVILPAALSFREVDLLPWRCFCLGSDLEPCSCGLTALSKERLQGQ